IKEVPFLHAWAGGPHAAGGVLKTAEEVRRKYGLSARYVFYPASYLPLKNPLYVLEGLCALERRHGIFLHAVFCGSGPPMHKVTVERQVQALGLMERVHCLEWGAHEDVPAIYE